MEIEADGNRIISRPAILCALSLPRHTGNLIHYLTVSDPVTIGEHLTGINTPAHMRFGPFGPIQTEAGTGTTAATLFRAQQSISLSL